MVAFSNRCFPTKAVAVWLQTTDDDHVALVRAYFDASGSWRDETGLSFGEVETHRNERSPWRIVVVGR